MSKLVGRVIVLLVLGLIIWAGTTIYITNPERRLAGRWTFDSTHRMNAQSPGGSQLEFTGKQIRVTDSQGSEITTLHWVRFQYGNRSEGEFPTSLTLYLEGSDHLAIVSLSEDETRMAFIVAGDGPSRANVFRKLP